MRAFYRALIGLTLLAVAGCHDGGSGTGGGGTFSTTVPASSQIQNLTPAQANQICSDLTDYLNQQLDSQSFCQPAAVIGTAAAAAQDSTLTDAQLQQVCQQAATQACPSADGGTASCGSPAGCSATVEQIGACANDYAAYLKQFEAMFPTCSMITRAKLASVNPDASPDMEPASCKPLDTSCPNWGPMTMMSGG
jgi:hypothetical protein